MNPIKVMKGLLDLNLIEKEVTKTWQKKASFLQDLNETDLHLLDTINLNLIEGLKFKGDDAQKKWLELKKVKKMMPDTKEFALFLYENYPKHSIKKMGFD